MCDCVYRCVVGLGVHGMYVGLHILRFRVIAHNTMALDVVGIFDKDFYFELACTPTFCYHYVLLYFHKGVARLCDAIQ